MQQGEQVGSLPVVRTSRSPLVVRQSTDVAVHQRGALALGAVAVAAGALAVSALAIGRAAIGEPVLRWRRAKPAQPDVLIIGELIGYTLRVTSDRTVDPAAEVAVRWQGWRRLTRIVRL